MAFDFPSSPTTGQQYLTPNGLLYLYNGSSWNTLGIELSPNPFSNYFLYRVIYTRGYVTAGYKNSVPWKNSNRTVHATDITTNLGDIIDYPAAYIDGGYSDYNQYIYGDSNAVGGNSTWTTSLSMLTETARSHNSNWDTKTTRGDPAILLNPGLTIAYITGGGSSATDKHNLVTEIMYNVGSAPAAPYNYGTVACFFGETRGWISNGNTSYLTFSTEVYTAGGLTFATDGQGKALGSKRAIAYGKPGSYASTNAFHKFNDLTGVTISTNLTTPDTSGEENFEIGQNWGYCLGNYNGLQNNNTYKVNYLTDAITVMGADTQPKGHDGMSSGCNASAGSQIIGGA